MVTIQRKANPCSMVDVGSEADKVEPSELRCDEMYDMLKEMFDELRKVSEKNFELKQEISSLKE